MWTLDRATARSNYISELHTKFSISFITPVFLHSNVMCCMVHCVLLLDICRAKIEIVSRNAIYCHKCWKICEVLFNNQLITKKYNTFLNNWDPLQYNTKIPSVSLKLEKSTFYNVLYVGFWNFENSKYLQFCVIDTLSLFIKL